MESKINLYHVSSYVKSNNLDHYKILEQAYEKKMFASQDNELLKNSPEYESLYRKQILH